MRKRKRRKEWVSNIFWVWVGRREERRRRSLEGREEREREEEKEKKKRDGGLTIAPA
jgi:hypothetical protein